jgi:hypothetical protein
MRNIIITFVSLILGLGAGGTAGAIGAFFVFDLLFGQPLDFISFLIVTPVTAIIGAVWAVTFSKRFLHYENT